MYIPLQNPSLYKAQRIKAMHTLDSWKTSLVSQFTSHVFASLVALPLKGL